MPTSGTLESKLSAGRARQAPRRAGSRARRKSTSGYIWKYAQQVGTARMAPSPIRAGLPRSRAMRIFSVLASAAALVLVLRRSSRRGRSTARPSPPQRRRRLAMSPVDAMRTATEALKTGEKTRAVMSLQYAAEHGHGFALWKLGRMYADGDGVARDDYRAFEYFQNSPTPMPTKIRRSPRARFVANAFVALGHYYLDGIPNTPVTAEPELARADVRPRGVLLRRPRGAVPARRALPRRQRRRHAIPSGRCRWLVLAANKGHYKSQALLGRILFNGEHGIAPARVGPDVAHRRLRRAGRQGAVDRRAARDRGASRPPTTSARWR